MSKRISNKWFLTLFLVVFASFDAFGQAHGTYTPYSIYGVGDLSQPGSAYSKTMGGVGVAVRNNNYLNLINPAAVTARDSLAFMADFSLYSDNKIFNQGGIRSASNTFNIGNLAMSFPLWHNTAMMVGVMPYSDTGFGYSFDYTDPALIGQTGNISYSADGSGSIYKAFAAAGVTLFRKRLSLGVQWNLYFGQVSKTYYTTFVDASYSSIRNSTKGQITGNNFKFGLQYDQSIGTKHALTVGATYSTSARLGGTMELSRLSGGDVAIDTLLYQVNTLGTDTRVNLAGEVSVGIAFREKGRWSAAFDYTRADWRNCGLDGSRGFMATNAFSASVAETYRVGFEIVPNRNDIRYYLNHVAYRAGAYHKKEYYQLNGQPVTATGITLGVTLPIVNAYNGLTLGVDFGQRGSLTGGQIRERYVNFSIGFNLYDIWFRKPQYD
ncbi:MAG: hypothetical protein K6E35_00680 [Bacteroidales bacterium]|nr:hypothetical protein [Bacteroidales bacterium]